TSACRERPVRSTLFFYTFRENITTSRQTSSEGHSVRHGRSWICFTNFQFTCLVQLFTLQSSDNLQKYEIINNIYL
ncbi:hypothetical protein, partial [Waltera sp.]|uniref:hypothetical protein n=1 Tax=Waltera sp. TaxID=2815806 RepID=UPI003AB5E2EC